MTQFRLTKKFATDIKVIKLGPPELTSSVLDDWFIDVIRVQRKKVAIATHGKSLLTFLLPYEEVGGAKSVPNCVGVLLGMFFRENDLDVDEGQVEKIFSEPPIFCKTDNRKVLGHMNDFKNCVLATAVHHDLNFHDINWDEVMHSINHTPVNMQGYAYPIEIAKELFLNRIVN